MLIASQLPRAAAMTEVDAPSPAPCYRFDRFELRPAERTLRADGQPVKLGGRAFDMLVALVERRDRVVGKHELMDLAWPRLVVEENNLQAQVGALRKLLGPAAIATVPSRGYRFTLAAQTAGALPADLAPPGAAGTVRRTSARTGTQPAQPVARRGGASAADLDRLLAEGAALSEQEAHRLARP